MKSFGIGTEGFAKKGRSVNSITLTKIVKYFLIQKNVKTWTVKTDTEENASITQANRDALEKTVASIFIKKDKKKIVLRVINTRMLRNQLTVLSVSIVASSLQG